VRQEISVTAFKVAPPAIVYYWHKVIEVLPDFILVGTSIYTVMQIALVAKRLRAKNG
jgi:hypothetical protein